MSEIARAKAFQQILKARDMKENPMMSITPIDPTFSQSASFEGFMRAAIKVTHSRNQKWWHDPATGATINRNVGEMLMLVVSEIAEGMEGHRKNLMDDKLPQYSMLTVELADAIIRIFDIAGGLNLDVAAAFRDKMEYNATRLDHTNAARLAPGGKKY
jgi:NTP pyrophosphatase (non-canonical NTP hydrolase)